VEETNSKKKPPGWWIKVIDDLEKATYAAKRIYKDSNIVLGINEDEDDNIIGYLIRQQDGSVGYYPSKKIKKKLPIGSKIKGNLPKPEFIMEEPKLIHFITGVIYDNIKLVPKLWLRKILLKIIGGQPIVPKEDLKPFPEWVLIPSELRKDKALIDLLYRAVEYEGLKGLARFNDKKII